jgi:hypothetical protein
VGPNVVGVDGFLRASDVLWACRGARRRCGWRAPRVARG